VSSEEQPPPSPEQSAAALLDQVMRGERVVLMPPGGFVASLFVPCLCFAAVPLAFLLVAPALPLDASEGLAPLLWPLGLALAMVTAGGLGMALVVFGRKAARSWLLWYVRGLLLLAASLSAGLALGWLRAPAAFSLLALAALAACHGLLSSWSFTAVTAFFAVKRRYRQERLATRGK
jgi:hypothetical protein